MLMENSTSLDIRTEFVNVILFGSSIAPEITKSINTSAEFNHILQLKYDNEREQLLYPICSSFLKDLDNDGRLSLIDLMTSDGMYCKFIFAWYLLSKNHLIKSFEDAQYYVTKDLLEFKIEGKINDSVIQFFKIILDRLSLFKFKIPGKINNSEYLRITSKINNCDIENYFL